VLAVNTHNPAAPHPQHSCGLCFVLLDAVSFSPLYINVLSVISANLQPLTSYVSHLQLQLLNKAIVIHLLVICTH